MEQLTVYKIGGNVIDDNNMLQIFIRDLASLPGKKILVHGGGKIASSIGKALGIEPKFVDGRRITDRQTLDVVTMVYAGLINKQVVALLQAAGINSIGLSGADANIIPAAKRDVSIIDYGYVGDVSPLTMNTVILRNFIDSGLLPVISPITHDQQGSLLNTNADTIASSVAVALSAFYNVSLIYCFERDGVIDTKDCVIPAISKNEFESLKKDKIITDGMIPKMENAFKAIESGVSSVRICNSSQIKFTRDEVATGTLLSI
jgi:acetylglutamate kinase